MAAQSRHIQVTEKISRGQEQDVQAEGGRRLAGHFLDDVGRRGDEAQIQRVHHACIDDAAEERPIAHETERGYAELAELSVACRLRTCFRQAAGGGDGGDRRQHEQQHERCMPAHGLGDETAQPGRDRGTDHHAERELRERTRQSPVLIQISENGARYGRVGGAADRLNGAGDDQDLDAGRHGGE